MSPKGSLSFDLGSQLAARVPAGDWVLFDAPAISKEPSWLQDVLLLYQENSLRGLHIGGQEVLARVPLSLAGALDPLYPAGYVPVHRIHIERPRSQSLLTPLRSVPQTPFTDPRTIPGGIEFC